MRIIFNVVILLIIQTSVGQEISGKRELDWKLGVQAYTFKNFTFSEALDKAKEIGLSYVEAYPDQEIGNGIKGTMHYSMGRETMEKVKALLKSKGITLVAYGVVSGKDMADWEMLLKFAQAMGVEVITSEPAKQDLEAIDELAGIYGLTIALHNHPKPSIYWDPETVLSAIEGKENIRACADVGHWIRSGLDPVEYLKKLEGKIASLHFKDLNNRSGDAHDVPWGTGVSDVKAMIEELERQKFEGLFSIEYEHNWDNSLPEIEKSVEFFRTTAINQ